MLKRMLCVLALSLSFYSVAAAAAECADIPLTGLARNKAIATAFYDLAFNQKRPAEAVACYVGETYIQHNPHVADGKAAFIKAVTSWTMANPEMHVEIKRVVAEGNYVVTHVHIGMHKDDPGMAAMDIFRLQNGKVVEHWDAVQVVPEQAANQNGMF